MKNENRNYVLHPETKFYCTKEPKVTFILLLTSYSVAQLSGTSSYEVQKIPENPDVAELGKFGDVPVNKYNGTANVSIHMHKINLDGHKIPIVLRYDMPKQNFKESKIKISKLRKSPIGRKLRLV